MRRKSVRDTDAEIELAKKLLARAQASGTLKPPRGLAATALSHGYRRSVSQTVTYRDYLRDARGLSLARRRVSVGARRK
jgi:hypothetical protein